MSEYVIYNDYDYIYVGSTQDFYKRKNTKWLK